MIGRHLVKGKGRAALLPNPPKKGADMLGHEGRHQPGNCLGPAGSTPYRQASLILRRAPSGRKAMASAPAATVTGDRQLHRGLHHITNPRGFPLRSSANGGKAPHISAQPPPGGHQNGPKFGPHTPGTGRHPISLGVHRGGSRSEAGFSCWGHHTAASRQRHP